MNIPEYVEMEFAMPFYEFYFEDTWNDKALPKNPFELKALSQKLNIILDCDFLFSEYEDTKIKAGDIYIFYQNNNKEIFMYFDLLKDEYDQMAMVTFGVRVKMENKREIKDILKQLYFKSTTRSDFQEDYFNASLNRVATDRIPNQNRKVKQFMKGEEIV
jgi:hypothetical protein